MAENLYFYPPDKFIGAKAPKKFWVIPIFHDLKVVAILFLMFGQELFLTHSLSVRTEVLTEHKTLRFPDGSVCSLRVTRLHFLSIITAEASFDPSINSGC